MQLELLLLLPPPLPLQPQLRTGGIRQRPPPQSRIPLQSPSNRTQANDKRSHMAARCGMNKRLPHRRAPISAPKCPV